MTYSKRRNTVIILLLVLIFSLFQFTFLLYQHQDSRKTFIRAKIESALALIQSQSDMILTGYQRDVEALMVSEQEVSRLLAQRAHDELYNKLLPLYKRLNADNRHPFAIEFILLDNTMLLRMAAPDVDHDSVPAELKATARDEPRERRGFGVNEYGFHFKVDRPLYIEEKFIGRLVYYIPVEQYLDDLRNGSGIRSILLLNPGILQYGGIDSDESFLFDEYAAHPYGDISFFRALSDPNSSATAGLVEPGTDSWRGFLSEFLVDSDGAPVGRTFHAVDVFSIEERYQSGLFRSLLISCAYGFGMFWILFFANNYLFFRSSLKPTSAGSETDALEDESVSTGWASKVDALLVEKDELTHELKRLASVQESLNAALERWRRNFNVINIPVIILDLNLRVVEINEAARELIGESSADIIGRTCWKLFPDNVTLCEICPADMNCKIRTCEERTIEQNYRGKTLRVGCAPVHGPKGLTGYVLTALDMTRQKNLESQLIQAQKMEAIATLAGGIAHDFNNILGAILGNTDLLLYRIPVAQQGNGGLEPPGKPLSFPEVADHLKSIKKAGNRAKELVRQILAFSRQSGSELQDVDITPVVKEAVKLLRSSLPSTISIKFNFSRDISLIHGDPTQIQQILMNLGANAAQAMEGRDGCLDIQMREIEAGSEEITRYHGLKPGRYVVLSVADTGHGMSRATMARIFDPFFTTRSVGKGAGMGLSVIHGIVVAHGGVVDVQSEEGKGSTFTLFFPCVAEQRGVMEETLADLPGGGENILFVDDEEDIVKLRKRMLEYLGYNVQIATAGDQALEIIKQDPPAIDVVITDLTMPRMNGLRLATELKKIRDDLPVILCSGFSEVVSNEEAHQAGVTKFMAKPLDMHAFANAIREVLSDPE